MKRIYRQCSLCKETKRTTSKKSHFTCRRCRGKMRILAQSNVTRNFPYFKKGMDILDLKILYRINEGFHKAREVSTNTKTPLTTIYNRLSWLKIAGLIYKESSLHFLTEVSKNQISNLEGWDLGQILSEKNNNQMIRFHALQGKFIVEHPPNNYERYLKKYYKIPIGKNKRMTGFKLYINYCIVVFYNPNSISITIPDVLIDNKGKNYVGRGFADIGRIIDSVARELERLFKGLKINSFCPFELDSQHIALRKSKFARNYYKQNKEFLKGNKIITDKSKGEHELEAIDSQTAGEDIEKCIDMESKQTSERKDTSYTLKPASQVPKKEINNKEEKENDRNRNKDDKM